MNGDAAMRYGPLLSLTVLHRFEPGERAGALRFDATPETARWLANAGAVVRVREGRLDVLLPAGALAVWRDAEVPALQWSARFTGPGPGFARTTSALPPEPGQLFLFDAARAVPADDGGAPWLHAGETAGPEALCCAAALDLAGAGRPGPLSLPPDFVVRLPWAALRDGGAAFRIRFGARAAVWKYCLIGDWAADGGPQALQVVDPARQASFTPPEPDALDSGEPMLAVRSTEPIELRARSERRFQLKSRGGAAERVLVKRLPVAGADHFARETIHGVSTLVSEIYVHR